jgi:hypothetical protein
LHRRSPWIDPEDFDLATIPVSVTFKDLDRRSLSSSIRSKKGEDLSSFDIKVDAMEHFYGSI